VQFAPRIYIAAAHAAVVDACEDDIAADDGASTAAANDDAADGYLVETLTVLWV
jgi:hypothetical protein